MQKLLKVKYSQVENYMFKVKNKNTETECEISSS